MRWRLVLTETTTDIDSAKFYLDLLASLSASNPKDEKIYGYYNQTAGLFYKNLGKPKKALPYMIKTLEGLQRTPPALRA